MGNVSVEQLLSIGRYELQLQADLSQLAATRAELARERDRRQTVLVDAEAEVKRFEKLCTDERETYQTRLNVRQQADADERSTQAYILARRVTNP